MSNTLAQLCQLIIVFLTQLVAFQVLTVAGFESYAKRECPRFQIKKHTIIKTKLSEANGAEYLARNTVSSSRHCHDLCCENDKCNLVLLKYIYKERMYCYMFNCGSPSKCLFHSHSSYTNYVALQFDDREFADSIPTTTQHRLSAKEATTEDVHTTPLKHYWQPKVFKSTEESREWYHVTSTPAPYHEISEHTAVKTNNEGNRLGGKLGPKTTTIYDSGKDGFTSNLKPSFVTTKAPAASFDWHQATQKETSSQGYDGSESTFDHSYKSEVNPDASKHPKAKTPEDDGNIGKNPEEEGFERRVWIDKNPNYPEQPKRPKQPKQFHSNKPMFTNTPTKVSTKNQETQTSIIINKFNIQQNKAVIPLAVGLIIALLLLMAVVFRMRTSRRRRTKAFLTDDADYLINGMYL